MVTHGHVVTWSHGHMVTHGHMEAVNNLQDERRGCYSAFDRAIEFTPMFATLLHVNAMWEEAEKGENSENDPLSQAILNGAEAARGQRLNCRPHTSPTHTPALSDTPTQQVRADLLSRLGTDLTIENTTNPLYHTGGKL